MKKIIAVFLVFCLTLGIFSSCGSLNGLNPKKPVTLTMWHNFGGDMQKTMDFLIDEFNSTAGKEQGIIINVTAIASSAELQNALNMILNEDPGAPEMPNIFTCYPKTAILFQEKGLLANLDSYFSEEELNAYIPAFVEEGRLGDGGLYVFPFAKSTEILYLNYTLFDRFSQATGVSIEALSTFEGIADAAQQYYQWTDSLTPDILNDGKQFFAADSWTNLAQAGMIQQGDSLFQEKALNLDNAAYSHIFKTCFAPSVAGGFAIYDGYSSDLSKTGDLVCSTGSSAGILFYGDTITYPDNTVEQAEYKILPYPVFEGGEKFAIQRGNGFSVSASDKTQEYAAALFLKWFTDPEQNMRFVSSTGYLPVTTRAFEENMEDEIEQVEDSRIKKMLTAVMEMYAEYSFFTTPAFSECETILKKYEQDYKSAMTIQREQYLSSDSPDLELLEENALEQWKNQMTK